MSADAAITIRGLEKSYGDVHAVAGIDLRAQAGTVLGLLGPNGAGKATVVRTLTTTNLISLTIMIAVGLLVGFTFDAGVVEIAAGVLLMLLFGYAFSWVFAFVGLTSSSP